MNIGANLIIRPEDIRANPELWIQKINVILFNDQNGKPWWTKEYKFLPNHERYNRAVKWIRDTEFAEYNCRIVQNENNEIEIITRNYFGKIASLEQEEKETLRKIKRKLGKIIREFKEERQTDWQKWKNINPNFSEKMVKEWKQEGFTYQQAKEWIDIGFNGNDASFCAWLRDIKKLSSEQVLNYGSLEELREEFGLEIEEEEEWSPEEIKELGKSKKAEEFLESEFRGIYEEEAEKLERLEEEKENLGENEQGISYDLMRPDLAILWRKQLYFVVNARYIDNWKLTCQIRARKCLLGMYYWNWMRGGGTGFLEKGPVIEDKGQRMHYEFCGDLGIKKVYQKDLGYQPKFALFKAISEGKDLTWSQGTQDKKMIIPTNVNLEEFNQINAELLMANTHQLTSRLPSLIQKITKPGQIISELMETILNQKVNLVVGCEEMPNISGHLGQSSLFQQSFEREDVLFTDKPSWTEKFKKQPHLWDHTTFQFYFFNEEITPANARFLKIKAKDANGQEVEDWESQPKKVSYFTLPYKVFISNSPGNLHYRLEFEYINVKLGVKTQAVFQGNSMVNYLTHIQVEAATFGGGLSWNEEKGQLAKMNKKDKNKAKKKDNEEKKITEKFDKLADSMFNSNTIDFNYSLGEFFTRLTNPLLMYRIVISELLFNRLTWANNRQKMLNLPVQWPAYGEFAQKLGEWKWKDVKLESDFNGFFKEKMEQGYVLTDGQLLEKPNFDYDKWGDYLKVPGSAWDIYVAEEEKTEIETPGEDKQITQGDPDVNNQVTKGGAFDTFLEFESQEAFSQFKTNLKGPAVSQLWNTVQGTKISWGRFLTGGTDGGNSEWHWNSGWAGIGSEWVANMNTGAGTKIRMKLNNTGGIDEETLRSGDYQIHIKFPSLENIQIWITGGVDKKTITTFKEGKKTETQEIDQSELENQEKEKEFENEGELDLENIEQEKTEQGLGERSKEREQEREQEKEQEFEKEQEQETEKENEREAEQEREQEREREKEREKEREAEREQVERERQEQERQEREQEDEEEIEL